MIIALNTSTGIYYTGPNQFGPSGWNSKQIDNAHRFTEQPRLSSILTDPAACGHQIQFIQLPLNPAQS